MVTIMTSLSVHINPSVTPSRLRSASSNPKSLGSPVLGVCCFCLAFRKLQGVLEVSVHGSKKAKIITPSCSVPHSETPRALLWSVRLPQRVGLCRSGVFMSGSPRTEQSRTERGGSTGSPSVPVRTPSSNTPLSAFTVSVDMFGSQVGLALANPR